MPGQDEIKTELGKEARELVQSLLKARKNLRLYPVNNPMYTRTVEDTFKRVDDILAAEESLELLISRNDISVAGESVYRSEEKDENLALFFFRDGLRSLSFVRGLGKEEFQDFLSVLSYDFDREDVEDDLVTLLWERDFRFIRYTVDETVLMEDDGYEEKAVSQAKEDASTDEGLRKAYEDAFKAEDVDGQHVPMSITDADLKALASEVEKDMEENKQSKLMGILFDMLYGADTLEEFKDITRIMMNAVEFSVRRGDLKTPANIFRRIRILLKKSRSPHVRKNLGMVLAFGGSEQVVKVIGEWLDTKGGPDEEDCSRYVGNLESNAIASFISLLGELETIGGRKSAIDALVVLGRKDVEALARGLRDPRWFVVRNIVYILWRMGDPRAVDYLVRVVNHPEPRVRKEVLKGLGELKEPKAVQPVALCLEDGDPSVRMTAAKALAAVGSEEAKAALLERMPQRRLMATEFREMKEYFEALSAWKDRDIYDFLMGLLTRKPFFRRSKYKEVKACAVYALGLLGNPEALPVLEGLRNARNRMLSEQAGAAVKRISYGRQR
ncbi:MAG: HEAT repeat domain-containing protein [Nitrospirota bacterium]|jgi:hypothetical protein